MSRVLVFLIDIRGSFCASATSEDLATFSDLLKLTVWQFLSSYIGPGVEWGFKFIDSEKLEVLGKQERTYPIDSNSADLFAAALRETLRTRVSNDHPSSRLRKPQSRADDEMAKSYMERVQTSLLHLLLDFKLEEGASIDCGATKRQVVLIAAAPRSSQELYKATCGEADYYKMVKVDELPDVRMIPTLAWNKANQVFSSLIERYAKYSLELTWIDMYRVIVSESSFFGEWDRIPETSQSWDVQGIEELSEVIRAIGCSSLIPIEIFQSVAQKVPIRTAIDRFRLPPLPQNLSHSRNSSESGFVIPAVPTSNPTSSSLRMALRGYLSPIGLAWQGSIVIPQESTLTPYHVLCPNVAAYFSVPTVDVARLPLPFADETHKSTSSASASANDELLSALCLVKLRPTQSLTQAAHSSPAREQRSSRRTIPHMSIVGLLREQSFAPAWLSGSTQLFLAGEGDQFSAFMAWLAAEVLLVVVEVVLPLTRESRQESRPVTAILRPSTMYDASLVVLKDALIDEVSQHVLGGVIGPNVARGEGHHSKIAKSKLRSFTRPYSVNSDAKIAFMNQTPTIGIMEASEKVVSAFSRHWQPLSPSSFGKTKSGSRASARTSSHRFSKFSWWCKLGWIDQSKLDLLAHATKDFDTSNAPSWASGIDKDMVNFLINRPSDFEDAAHHGSDDESNANLHKASKERADQSANFNDEPLSQDFKLMLRNAYARLIGNNATIRDTSFMYGKLESELMETIKSALKVCQPSDEDSTPLDMVRKFVEKELLKNTEDFREFYVNQPSASGQLIVQKIKECCLQVALRFELATTLNPKYHSNKERHVFRSGKSSGRITTLAKQELSSLEEPNPLKTIEEYLDSVGFLMDEYERGFVTYLSDVLVKLYIDRLPFTLRKIYIVMDRREDVPEDLLSKTDGEKKVLAKTIKSARATAASSQTKQKKRDNSIMSVTDPRARSVFSRNPFAHAKPSSAVVPTLPATSQTPTMSTPIPSSPAFEPNTPRVPPFSPARRRLNFDAMPTPPSPSSSTPAPPTMLTEPSSSSDIPDSDSQQPPAQQRASRLKSLFASKPTSDIMAALTKPSMNASNLSHLSATSRLIHNTPPTHAAARGSPTKKRPRSRSNSPTKKSMAPNKNRKLNDG